MDQQIIDEGRRLLTAVTPGPYRLSRFLSHTRQGYGFAPLPLSTERGLERIEDANAILWLLEHAEELLTLAERVAAVQVQTTDQDRRMLDWQVNGFPADDDLPATNSAINNLLMDAITLAALVEAVRS